MTRNLIFSLSFTVLLIVSGCYYTQVASPQQSSEEKAWEALIMDSYSGYEPPPAVIRNDRKRPTVTPIAKAEPQSESNAAKPEALSSMLMRIQGTSVTPASWAARSRRSPLMSS